MINEIKKGYIEFKSTLDNNKTIGTEYFEYWRYLDMAFTNDLLLPNTISLIVFFMFKVDLYCLRRSFITFTNFAFSPNVASSNWIT